jgi:16S rRNA U1498 N3-methylase RsmE
LKAASEQVEVTLFRDSGKGKEVEKTVEKEVELGKD